MRVVNFSSMCHIFVISLGHRGHSLLRIAAHSLTSEIRPVNCRSLRGGNCRTQLRALQERDNRERVMSIHQINGAKSANTEAS